VQQGLGHDAGARRDPVRPDRASSARTSSGTTKLRPCTLARARQARCNACAPRVLTPSIASLLFRVRCASSTMKAEISRSHRTASTAALARSSSSREATGRSSSTSRWPSSRATTSISCSASR
jgi:hypothetical protein